jgi:hypothetical protein
MAPKRKADDANLDGEDTADFSVRFDNNECTIRGRPEWLTRAKSIKVTNTEDRRHMLHYDEIIKPAVERVITKMLASDTPGVIVTNVLQAMKRSGLKRLPNAPTLEDVVLRLTKELNSVDDNLIPGRADTNKAIELVRHYLRKARDEFYNELIADAAANDRTRMPVYMKAIEKHLLTGPSGFGITAQRNEIHRTILDKLIKDCTTPKALQERLQVLIDSVTFDLPPDTMKKPTDPNVTAKLLKWQSDMAKSESASGADQLNVLVGLLNM